MKVFPEKHEEYEACHNEIWPEMVSELKKHGVKSYSIFLEKETSQLFGYLEIEDEEKWGEMSKTEINQKWWAYMESVMETNPDKSPISKDLKEVFHLE
jgi:L-rhamnose mutarotase